VEPRFFPLSAITRRIEELLQPAFGKTFWVKAEIASGRERNGAFYCDLVETDASGKLLAQLRCNLFADDLARMRARFEAAGLALVLDDGTVVGMQCRLAWHARFGLSLTGLDLDPATALGELELRRRRILERLRAEGLLDRNARLSPPRFPWRIALVASRDSAGCEDFVQTLVRSGFGFRIWIADTHVQGVDASARMCRALDAVARLPVDLVAIVRGGGSKTDLGALDDEAIARRIAALPLPVWTGIGHETDTSVLDHVAARAFKTPTAVAEEIVARFTGLELELGAAERRLRSAWALRLEPARRWLADARVGLAQGTRKLVELSRARLGRQAHALDSAVSTRLSASRAGLARSGAALRAGALQRAREETRRLANARARLRPEPLLERLRREHATLAARAAAVRAADPATSLARGFALIETADGRLVRSVRDVATGEEIRARVADGRIAAVVSALAPGGDDGGHDL
jgi:exodeoxyribonuclease VII large subunit